MDTENTTPTDIDIDALIDGAQLAERSLPLCLRQDLVARWEELDAQREAASKRAGRDSLAGSGGDAATIALQMEELRTQMAAATVTVVVRALPRPAFQKLLKVHPPRRDDDGKTFDEDADHGVNTSTFWGALLRASWQSPVISKARMAKLLDELLSDRQFEQLANLAMAVNRGDFDIPFSFAASRLLPSSSPE